MASIRVFSLAAFWNDFTLRLTTCHTTWPGPLPNVVGRIAIIESSSFRIRLTELKQCFAIQRPGEKRRQIPFGSRLVATIDSFDHVAGQFNLLSMRSAGVLATISTKRPGP